MVGNLEVLCVDSLKRTFHVGAMEQLLCDETFDPNGGYGGRNSGGGGILEQLEGLGQPSCWSPSLDFDIDVAINGFMVQEEPTMLFPEVLPLAPGSPLNTRTSNGINTYDFQGFNVPTGKWDTVMNASITWCTSTLTNLVL